MELFSNNTNDIWQRARQELSEKNPSTCVLYSEMPHFHSEFSICIQKNELGELLIVTKWWDKHHDLRKYHQLGLSNLDRLRILERTKKLTEIEKDLLQNILKKLEFVKLPDSIEEKGWIVLDSCEYQLIFNIKDVQKEYTWRIANGYYIVIEGVIKFLIEKSSLLEFQGAE